MINIEAFKRKLRVLCREYGVRLECEFEQHQSGGWGGCCDLEGAVNIYDKETGIIQGILMENWDDIE